VPYDTESYVHRIGRTGRAGRSGEAILFVSPREKNMLYAIEKATRKRIELMELPSTEIINDKRIEKFKQRITDTIAAEDLAFFSGLIEQYCHEHDVPELEAAAALASMVQGDTPLLFTAKPERQQRRQERERSFEDAPPQKKRRRDDLYGDEPRELYRLEVGGADGVQPGNILGAIINEIGLDPEAIGRISISDTFSTVELPAGMPNDVYHELRKVRVCGKQLRVSKMEGGRAPSPYGGKGPKRGPKPSGRDGGFFTGPKKRRKG